MSNPKRNRSTRWGARRVLGLVFLLGGCLLLTVGASSVGAGVFMRRPTLPDGWSWKRPLDLVSQRDLEPATVLLPLTGMPAGDALNASLDAGHWEDAFTLIAYDSTLADPVRVGALLQLGSRYADARNNDKSAWCYLAAARIATISPLLSDAIRDDTFLQAAAGLREVGALEAARLLTDQAYLVAQYSPALRREQQSRRMTQIANAYAALGAMTLADEARARAADPVAPVEQAGYLPRELFVVRQGMLPASPAVKQAAEIRMAAARQLVQDLQDVQPNHPADWPRDSVDQLRGALVKEDEVRVAFYNEQLAQSREPSVRIALLRDQADWLALKYRMARGAFGADLVPEWGEKPAAVGDGVSHVWSELSSVYETQALAIPNAQAVSQAMEDVTRQELLVHRWGWYEVSTLQLFASLSDLTRQLREAAIPSLRLDALTINGKTTEVLLPDELYGKNAQALPH